MDLMRMKSGLWWKVEKVRFFMSFLCSNSQLGGIDPEMEEEKVVVAVVVLCF